jgi:hypothetical protein
MGMNLAEGVDSLAYTAYNLAADNGDLSSIYVRGTSGMISRLPYLGHPGQTIKARTY